MRLSVKEIMSFQSPLSRLLYVRELVRKLSTNSLLVISSTTESFSGPIVRATSTEEGSIPSDSSLLIVAGFFCFNPIHIAIAKDRRGHALPEKINIVEG